MFGSAGPPLCVINHRAAALLRRARGRRGPRGRRDARGQLPAAANERVETSRHPSHLLYIKAGGESHGTFRELPLFR